MFALSLHYSVVIARSEITQQKRIDGTIRTVDLERITEHYHRGHISSKAAAGFQMFRGSSGATRRGTPRDHFKIGRVLE